MTGSVPVGSGNFSVALLPPIIAKLFGDSYKDVPSLYSQWMDVVKSSMAWEDIYGISGSGLARQVGDGQEFPFDSMQTEYRNRFRHQQYGLGMVVTKTIIEDQQANLVIPQLTKNLKKSMREVQEIVATDLLNNAFSGSVLYGDLKALCVSDHPTKGGTRSNVAAADFNEISLEQAELDILDYRDMAGLRIDVKVKQCIIPTATKAFAHRLLKSDLRPGTANNDTNYLKDVGFIPSLMVNRYLTDSDSWFLITDIDGGPKFFDRVPMSISQYNHDSTFNQHYMARMRFSVGVGDSVSVYGSPGA